MTPETVPQVVEALAHELALATELALSVMHIYAARETLYRVVWFNLADSGYVVRTAARYLELTGKLERHPENAALVRIRS